MKKRNDTRNLQTTNYKLQTTTYKPNDCSPQNIFAILEKWQAFSKERVHRIPKNLEI